MHFPFGTKKWKAALQAKTELELEVEARKHPHQDSHLSSSLKDLQCQRKMRKLQLYSFESSKIYLNKVVQQFSISVHLTPVLVWSLSILALPLVPKYHINLNLGKLK